MIWTCPGCKKDTLKGGGDSPENGHFPHCLSCGWNGDDKLSNSPTARATRVAKAKKVRA